MKKYNISVARKYAGLSYKDEVYHTLKEPITEEPVNGVGIPYTHYGLIKTVRDTICSLCHKSQRSCLLFDIYALCDDDYEGINRMDVYICMNCLENGLGALKRHSIQHNRAIKQAQNLNNSIGQHIKCIKYSGDVVEGILNKVSKERLIWIIKTGNIKGTKVDLLEVETVEV